MRGEALGSGLATRQRVMNKQGLAEQVAARTNVTVAQGRALVDATFDVIVEELTAGRGVAVAGFGRFSTSHRDAREGRSPSTGEPIRIAATTTARFSAAAGLKRHLNG